MQSSLALAIYLILHLNHFGSVLCDGDHHHDHAHEAGADAGTTTSTQTAHSGPTGTVTTVHTTSGDAGGAHNEGFASILSSISPDLISSLASNPQVAQALRSSGVDVGAATTAAKAAAAAGGRVNPPVGGGAGGYSYPSPLGGLGGFGGLPFPFFGPYKQLHVSGDFGAYYPFVEKAIIIFGGGILILVIIAILTKSLAKGGLLYNFGSGFSQALAGSASLDIGPIHKSISGAESSSAGVGRIVDTPDNVLLTQQVHNGLDQRF